MLNFNNKSISSVYDETISIEKIMKGTLKVYEAWRKLIASGVPPITLQKCKGVNLVDYKIYGESIQDGTPTPDTPIEIESVGDKTSNLFNPNAEIERDAIGYSGIILDKEKRYTMQIKLKDGKIVPNGIYFGFGYRYTNGTTNSAIWFTSNTGTITREFSQTPNSEVAALLVCVYPGNQENFNAIADAFDIMLVEGAYAQNTMPEYESYGYKIPVKVSGKNILSYPYAETNKTLKGITWTDNGDGTITANGTATENVFFGLPTTWYDWGGLISGETYYFSGCPEGGRTSTYYIGIQDSAYSKTSRDIGEGASYKANSNPVYFYLTVRKGVTVKDLTFKPMLSLSPIENYEPYVEPVTTNIYLNEPLKSGDYLDYKNQQLIKDSVPISVELPNIPTIKGTTIIEVDTEIQPSNMEIEYYRK